MVSSDEDDGTVDRETFHPLGEQWQDSLEEAIAETEYDADLGLEMAKDAMRVTEGELTEEAFYDRYHEDIVAEFGEDDRPMADEIEAEREAGRLEQTLSRFGVDGESRRDVMKKMGGASAVGLGAWGTAMGGGDGDSPEAAAVQEADDSEETDEGVQWGMALDLEYCDGCLACVVACADEHNWDQGANWMYILDYEDDTTSDEFTNRLIRPCQHCTDAPCEKVCPTTARHTRDSDGLVLTDYGVCIGCRYCQVACPYGVNYFQWEEPNVPEEEIDDEHIYDERDRPVNSRGPRGVMEKCTFCATRQDGTQGPELVGRTACEDACPPEVIQFGDMNDPNSDPQRYIDNAAKSRAIVRLEAQLPATEDVESALGGGDNDLDAVVDAVEDLDEETIALVKAVEILAEEDQPENEQNNTLVEQETAIIDLVGVLQEQGLDLESEDVLVELNLAQESDEDEEFDGPSENLAQDRLEAFAGTPHSRFKLLEDVGTNPNVVYLGNQPGPNAEQVEGPVAYDQVGQTDNRKDVLDDGTVGPDF
ncbi:4Fe-4S ferredoxin N-terminal domain-containing protein [Natronorubrum thiooxidans]|uniref:Prokaryotic molybdopterin-containing oxidoreductase family, iron-sulfur binding subunit n=1 Tax=Natronorubrum thiooxidans TaxID=308853 RepID=A0A1N7C9Q1_9EURY|nr:4Fe-4S ferredoxin N-terminal domain-containing protein [Natronorubrum thiooxidans]SIR60339.1 prokaryotic molybdopterin-containing oxidoreductase family, iron-sulfur binding subunit [Natronorubrum thiooxidans]